MNSNIIALRQILKEAYQKASNEEDFYSKSSDGYVGIEFHYSSAYYDDKEWEEEPKCVVKVYSYVFGPNRMHEFEGDNLEMASRKALSAVISWLKGDPQEDRDLKVIDLIK